MKNPTDDHHDEEFQVHSTRSNKKSLNSKRVYIGNLPNNVAIVDLTQRLQTLLQESLQIDVTVEAITVHGCTTGNDVGNDSGGTTNKRKKSPHALIDCPPGTADRIISKLHKKLFDGKKLVVQREQRKGGGGGGGSSIGGKQQRREGPNNFRKWSQPSSPTPRKNPATPSPTITTMTTGIVDNHKTSISLPLTPPPPETIDEAAERMGEVIAKEFENAETNGEDLVNLAIASTAAMSLLASMDAFGTPHYETNTDHDGAQEEEKKNNINEDHNYEEEGEEEEEGDMNPGDFMARCAAQPLSALMDDFGEADPNWMNVQPDNNIRLEEEQEEERQDDSNKPQEEQEQEQEQQTEYQQYESRLGQRGKAPIHVEFTSFGYLHGAPHELRNGWSHMNPLSPADCTDFPSVPAYLEWQDGLSAAVKRVLLQTSQYQIRDAATQLAHQVATAVQEAIADGHGYALPLNMSIFVGSHSGRHRSVLYCELAATALRKVLRTNKEDRIGQPVSVGTRHSQLDRQQGGGKSRGGTPAGRGQTKNKLALEGDW